MPASYLYQRPESTVWQAQKVVTLPNGQRKKVRKSLGTTDETEARVRLADFLKDLREPRSWYGGHFDVEQFKARYAKPKEPAFVSIGSLYPATINPIVVYDFLLSQPVVRASYMGCSMNSDIDYIIFDVDPQAIHAARNMASPTVSISEFYDDGQHYPFTKPLTINFMALMVQSPETKPVIESRTLGSEPVTPPLQPVSAPKMMLSELIEKFKESKLNKKAWKSDVTAAGVTSVLNILLKNMGDKPVNEITIEDVIDMRDRLSKTMKPLSVKRIYSLGRSVFAYGMERYKGQVTYQPFIQSEQIVGAVSTRRNFTLAELKTIYAPVNFSNLEGYQKWLPYIGVFTGARLNEIVCLHGKDIVQDGKTGVWYFDINLVGRNKSLKNKTAKRRVPIHSRLIELGLLVYAQGIGPNERLFKVHKTAASNWFGNYMTAIGLPDPDIVFHSYRHTLGTHLRSQGVDGLAIYQICGWTVDGNEFERTYDHSQIDLGKLKTALDKADFGI